MKGLDIPKGDWACEMDAAKVCYHLSGLFEGVLVVRQKWPYGNCSFLKREVCDFWCSWGYMA